MARFEREASKSGQPHTITSVSIRLLSRTGIPPYTQHPSQAMAGEPEAISANDQHTITQQANNRELHAWQTSRQRMLAELEHLRTHVHSPHVTRTTRALQRELDALDRKLST